MSGTLRATEMQKGYKGVGMEGAIARWYANNMAQGMDEYKKLARALADELSGGAGVLEVASGPGYLAIELAKLGGYRVVGLDISKTFVEIARRNAASEGVHARFEQGNAADLPVEDASLDFVVCRAAFKNFTEPVKALSEMKRVLRTGGTALVIDMRRDVPVASLKEYVKRLGVSRLNRWFLMLVFRLMLIPRAYPLDEVRRMASSAGWTAPRIEISPLGFEAWMTKSMERFA